VLSQAPAAALPKSRLAQAVAQRALLRDPQALPPVQLPAVRKSAPVWVRRGNQHQPKRALGSAIPRMHRRLSSMKAPHLQMMAPPLSVPQIPAGRLEGPLKLVHLSIGPHSHKVAASRRTMRPTLRLAELVVLPSQAQRLAATPAGTALTKQVNQEGQVANARRNASKHVCLSIIAVHAWWFLAAGSGDEPVKAEAEDESGIVHWVIETMQDMSVCTVTGSATSIRDTKHSPHAGWLCAM
jgi:hypothetical protein